MKIIEDGKGMEYRQLDNGWTREVERLRAVNEGLVAACKKMLAADTPETIEEAYALMKAAIKKAVTP